MADDHGTASSGDVSPGSRSPEEAGKPEHGVAKESVAASDAGGPFEAHMLAGLPDSVKFRVLDMIAADSSRASGRAPGNDAAAAAVPGSPDVGTLTGKGAPQRDQHAVHAERAAAAAASTQAPPPPKAVQQRAPTTTTAATSDADVLPRLLSPAQVRELTGPPEQACPGAVVVDGLFGESLVRRARTEAEELDSGGAGLLRPAGFGHEAIRHTDATKRSDRIVWLTGGQDGGGAAGSSPGGTETKGRWGGRPLPSAIARIVARLSAVHHQLAKAAPHLRLTPQYSVQLACYPGDGARYVRHIDAQPPRDTVTPIRRITALVYLNPDWEPGDGGCLRAYVPSARAPVVDPGAHEAIWDIDPKGGRLLLFQSDMLPHEVLPAASTRFSLTVWMYGTVDAATVSRSMPGAAVRPMAAKGAPRLPNPAHKALGNAAAGGAGGATATTQAAARRRKPGGATIFVSIPSYRDPQCQHTVANMFEKAAQPDRVFAGLCLQYDAAVDASCFDVPAPYPAQVRSVHIPHVEARGPTWARHLAAQLYRDERYVLQIDSHMRFEERWDETLINSLEQARKVSKKPVITTYPPAFELDGSIKPSMRSAPTLMCATKFGPDGMPRFSGRRLNRLHDEPIPSLFWAAGFSFSDAALLREVPYDPELPFLFFGEETSMLARMWTRGWDCFAPGKPVVYHLWPRSYRPTFREIEDDVAAAQGRRSLAKVRAELGIPQKVDSVPLTDERYALGHERTFAAFQEHTGLDFARQTVSDRAMRGGVDAANFALDGMRLDAANVQNVMALLAAAGKQ